jgi:Tol biopolymer transport system component
MDPSGGNLRLLMNYLNPGELASAPAWSPDGAFIVFATRRDGFLDLYQLRLDGLQLTRLTQNTSDDYDPDW